MVFAVRDVDDRDKPGHDGRGFRNGLPSLVEVLVQIAPIPVGLQDQTDFPGSEIVLHVFLALDRVADVLEELGVNEALQAIALRETLHQALAMFPGPAGEVAGDAGVEDAVRALVMM
jgi:hypothetical protein